METGVASALRGSPEAAATPANIPGTLADLPPEAQAGPARAPGAPCGEHAGRAPPRQMSEFAGGHAGNRVAMENPCEFAKTLESPEMFEAALGFYKFASAQERWRGVIPSFKRVETIEGRRFLVLENIVGRLEHPVLADFKLGTQTWAPGAGPGKVAKMRERDEETTTPSLGFRIVTAMLPQGDGPEAGYLSAGRVAVKQGLDRDHWRAARSRDDAHRVVAGFLGSPDLRRAFVEKLQPVIRVLQEQTDYHFYGSSLLVAYDHSRGASSLDMRLIDFGNCQGGQATVDEGVLTGLRSLQELVGSL